MLSFSERVRKWAAQGSGKVIVPGGVQEKWRCDTERHSLVVGGDGLMVGLDKLSDLSNLNDSVEVQLMFLKACLYFSPFYPFC